MSNHEPDMTKPRQFTTLELIALTCAEYDLLSSNDRYAYNDQLLAYWTRANTKFEHEYLSGDYRKVGSHPAPDWGE